MTASPKILALAGSLRAASLNKLLLRNAARLAEQAGASVTTVDLKALALPLYDQDLEDASGLPEGALEFKRLLKSHDGFLIASPEYNGSFSAALKNAIDWASRPMEGEAPLEAFKGKVASLIAASPGGLGGLRGLVPLRAQLGNIGVLVLPDQFALGAAHNAFDDQGALKEAGNVGRLEAVVAPLVQVTGRLHG